MSNLENVNNQQLTVKEIAEVLKVDERTIQRWVIKYYPEKVKNGVTTYLNEFEITTIKKEMNRNYSLGNAVEVITNVDKLETISKSMIYLQELLTEQHKQLDFEKTQKELALANNRLLVHDFSKTYTATELSRELGFPSATQLNDDLKSKKIQYKQNESWILYSNYADKGYTSLKEQVLDNGTVVYYRRWTGIGREFLINLYQD